MEFLQELVRHFDSWCLSSGITTFAGLRELVLLEQVNASVSASVATCVSDCWVKSVAETAALADDYHLTHSLVVRAEPWRILLQFVRAFLDVLASFKVKHRKLAPEPWTSEHT